MEFTITVQRAEEIAAKLRQVAAWMDDRLLRSVADELQAIGGLLEGQVKQRTPTDTGVLRASVFSELRITGQSLEEIISSPLVYGTPVEFGSKPHFPPPDALKAWARRKLGDEKLAFVVARAIAKRGTKPNNMFQDAWDANVGQVQQMLDNIGVHVSEELLRQL